MHRGDFDTSAVIYGKFTTYRPSTGAAYTLAGTPALSVYKDNSTTQSTTGVTLTADFDSVTGLNHFAIDTSADGTFYSAGSFFDVVITTGTVDSVSVVGSVVASFTIRKDSSLKPTTAGRTLDVSSGGEAGVDWANVGSPTTALALTGTTIASTQKVDIETIKTQTVTAAAGVTVLASVGTAATSTAQTGDSYARLGAPAGASVSADMAAVKVDTAAILVDTGTTLDARIPAALVGGRMDVSVGAMAANTLTAAATASDFGAEMATAIWTDTTAGDFTVALSVGKSVMNGVSLGTGLTVASVSGAVGSVAGAVASVTGNVSGNVTGSVGSVATGGITAASFGAGAVDAAAIAADAGTEIATAVWASAARTLTAATNFNNISTSDVLTQVNAAIDTAISELGVAAPTATPTLRTGLMLLYMALRNKLVVQTSGTDALEIYNDAGTKIASKLLTDTGGDYTEAEMS